MLAEKILKSNLSDKQKWFEIDKRTRYYTEPRSKRKMKDKLSIADNLMDRLNITGSMRNEVKYMISNEFKNFNKLNRRCTNEQIIGLMIFYVMKSYNVRANIKEYNVFLELKLNENIYITFATRLCRYYQNKIPIRLEL